MKYMITNDMGFSQTFTFSLNISSANIWSHPVLSKIPVYSITDVMVSRAFKHSIHHSKTGYNITS